MCGSSLPGNREIPRLTRHNKQLWYASGRRGALADDVRTWDVLPYRRFAAALTGDCARLGADVVSYSFIVSDLHRLLVAGLPAHCESSKLSKSFRQICLRLGW
jgi:hypothetical protein